MNTNRGSIPLTAINAFEKTTGLSVSIHDFSGAMYTYLPHEYFSHRSPCCIAVKSTHEASCIAFDVHRIRALTQEHPTGMMKVCFAGFVEWVVPHVSTKGLDWVLFAGQRLAGPKLSGAVWDASKRLSKISNHRSSLATVNDDEAQTILEMLRQLSARLILWRVEMEESATVPSIQRHNTSGIRLDVFTARRATIQHFIDSRHRMSLRLSDVAKQLHISESRAGHVVRESFGKSFIELLVSARLKTATNLLRYSNLPIIDVAERSGFNCLSHFHATFQDHLKVTPLRYRKKFETLI